MGAWHLHPGSSTCNFVYYVSQILLIKNKCLSETPVSVLIIHSYTDQELQCLSGFLSRGLLQH